MRDEPRHSSTNESGELCLKAVRLSLLFSTLLPAALFLLSSTYLAAVYVAAQRREAAGTAEPESLDSVVESEVGPASQTSTLTLSDNNNRSVSVSVIRVELGTATIYSNLLPSTTRVSTDHTGFLLP